MLDFKVFYDYKAKTDIRQTTICYLRRKNSEGKYEYLLGKHYKQKKWNGFGGKIGDKPEFENETVIESVQREGVEEYGVKVISPTLRAGILFDFFDTEGKENKVFSHVFIADQWEGEVHEITEMLSPTWFTLENIPWEGMWPIDSVWLKELLGREDFLEAEFKFTPESGDLAAETTMKWIKSQ